MQPGQSAPDQPPQSTQPRSESDRQAFRDAVNRDNGEASAANQPANDQSVEAPQQSGADSNSEGESGQQQQAPNPGRVIPHWLLKKTADEPEKSADGAAQAALLPAAPMPDTGLPQTTPSISPATPEPSADSDQIQISGQGSSASARMINSVESANLVTPLIAGNEALGGAMSDPTSDQAQQFSIKLPDGTSATAFASDNGSELGLDIVTPASELGATLQAGRQELQDRLSKALQRQVRLTLTQRPSSASGRHG